MKFGSWVLNNFWLKVLSLLLAVFTWFYVLNMIEGTSDKKTILAKILPYYSRMVSKKLFVKAVFGGELPEDYELIMEKVKIDPPYFIVAGPKRILNGVDSLQTTAIDISKFKKTVMVNAQILPIAQEIDTEKLSVKVIIPIKKLEPKQVKGVE